MRLGLIPNCSMEEISIEQNKKAEEDVSITGQEF